MGKWEWKGCGVFVLLFKDTGDDKDVLFVLCLACSQMALALARNVGEPGSLTCFALGVESAPREGRVPWLLWPSTLLRVGLRA